MTITTVMFVDVGTGSSGSIRNSYDWSCPSLCTSDVDVWETFVSTVWGWVERQNVNRRLLLDKGGFGQTFQTFSADEIVYTSVVTFRYSL